MKDSISYISTRGRESPMGFQDAVMTGLASDGGLLIPERLPDVSDRLESWERLDYVDLACEIMGLFCDLPDTELRRLVRAAYAGFSHPDIAPLVRAGPLHVLELFHGPTLAFKDIALQFLGRLFEYILERRGQRLNILAATSGDTGSAAIHGVRGRARIRLFVMHPRGRISPVQEKQMTSVLDDNIFNLAVDGSFDDCQALMKILFRDTAFKQRYALGAVNSVNWARVLAQIVYYVYAGLRLGAARGRRITFAVPTGNFGDILAGYYAAGMGLPVERLLLATNENDILCRFFQTGVYRRGKVTATPSPSMDIQVASNFERYLYDLCGGDPGRTSALLEAFERDGSLALPEETGRLKEGLIRAGSATRAETLETIGRFQRRYGYLADPHTAVGLHVAERLAPAGATVVCLATAHPAKFGDAIREATGKDLAHHPLLDALEGAPTRSTPLPADERALRDFIQTHAG